MRFKNVSILRGAVHISRVDARGIDSLYRVPHSISSCFRQSFSKTLPIGLRKKFLKLCRELHRG